MARYPDYRMAYWKNYTYVQGYMFEAMDRLGQVTGDAKYIDYMRKYIDHFLDKDGNYQGDKLTNLDNFVPCMDVLERKDIKRLHYKY